MKKVLITFVLPQLCLALISFSVTLAINVPKTIEIPGDVQQIIDKSCYVCHNSNSKDKKAKQKLDFDKLNYLKTYQVISKLDNIADAVIENEMPPKKFKKKHPEKILTRKDKEVLIDWIRQQTEQPKVSLESQLNVLVNQIVNSLDQNQKSKIAVMEFVNMQGQVTNLGRYLSEELTTRLYLTGKFEVIERQLLDKIVQEQKISLTGMVDESSAVELGKILGVDAIASGTISDLGSSVKVNARLISAESGKLFSVASVEIPKNDKVKVLLSQNVTSTATTAVTTSGTGGEAKPDAMNNPVITKGGFKFELMEARLEGQTAIFKMKVTNTSGEDKDFVVIQKGRKNGTYYLTMIYDDQGNETEVTSLTTGNKILPIKGWPGIAQKKVLYGSSIIVELTFENISPDVKTIPLLQIIFERYPGKILEFRNIPLKKN